MTLSTRSMPTLTLTNNYLYKSPSLLSNHTAPKVIQTTSNMHRNLIIYAFVAVISVAVAEPPAPIYNNVFRPFVFSARFESPPAVYHNETRNATEEGVATPPTPAADSTRSEESGKLVEDAFVEQGVYYVYHPDGLLQKVVYSTKGDVQDMGYTAQLKYEDVEPIRDPIYTYDPETLEVRQVKV